MGTGIYAPAIQADPVNLEGVHYLSIPKCYSLLSMEALNESGIGNSELSHPAAKRE